MKLDEDMVNLLGLWILRILVVIGVIIAALTGQYIVAIILAFVALYSFSL